MVKKLANSNLKNKNNITKFIDSAQNKFFFIKKLNPKTKVFITLEPIDRSSKINV